MSEAVLFILIITWLIAEVVSAELQIKDNEEEKQDD